MLTRPLVGYFEMNLQSELPDRTHGVSLVVPVRDEAATILDLLRSIRMQTLSPSEVVFVDGGSIDDTVTILRQAAIQNPSLRIIEARDATPGKGRNLGIAAAAYDWIALTDAGIQLEPNWLQSLIDEVRCHPATKLVLGNYEPKTTTFFEECAATAYVPPKQKRPAGLVRGPSVASCLLRRELWSAVGGFPDLRAAEDLIFMERCEQSGVQVEWAPAATVHWQLQPTLAKTFRRFVLYSRQNVMANRERHWHYGIAQQYLLALLLVVLAAVQGWGWLTLLFLAAWARVAKAIVLHREGRNPWWALNPVRFLMVAVILITIDLATFVGWGQAVSEKVMRVAGIGKHSVE